MAETTTDDYDAHSHEFKSSARARSGPTASTRSPAAPGSAPTSTCAGQLVGTVLRSPHAHARIISIDTSKAEALPGVKAVVTRADFGDQPSEFIPAGEMMMNYGTWCATSWRARRRSTTAMPWPPWPRPAPRSPGSALKLIKVEYEVLPHVIDVVEAMQPGRAAAARRSCSPPASSPSPRSPRTSPSASSSGTATSRPASPGRRHRRARVQDRADAPGLHRAARLRSPACPRTARPSSGPRPRATSSCAPSAPGCSAWTSASCASPPSEIGGGFGGKTVVYLEPLALALSRKAKRPVKMVMTREEVFRATGPTSGATRAGQDRRHEGRPHHRRPSPSSSTRPAPSRARRCSPAPCAPSRPTTSRTCT